MSRNGQSLDTVFIGFTETVLAPPANNRHVERCSVPSQSRAGQGGTRRRGWEGRTRTLGASGPASRADVRSAPPPIVEAASSPSRGDVSAPSVGTPALFPREESPSLSACPNFSIFTHFSILIAALLASKQGFMKRQYSLFHLLYDGERLLDTFPNIFSLVSSSPHRPRRNFQRPHFHWLWASGGTARVHHWF